MRLRGQLLNPLARKKSIEAGQIYEIEHRCRRGDGVFRWFQVRGLPVRDTENKITAWYLLLTDIEDRKRAEEDLRARELDARSLLDNMPGFLARLSPDGTPEIFNRLFLQYSGKTLDDLKKWRTSDIVHPDDLAHTIEVYGKAISTGQPIDLEYRLRRFDGAYRWFQARGIPVRIEGRILRWNALITDIDDRKKAEEALESSERNLSLMISAIPTYIHVLRTDGSVLNVNQAVLDYTGLSLEDVQKEDYRARIFHPEDVERLREERRDALTRAIPFENEQRVLGKDGRYRWFLNRYNPLLDEKGRIDRWYVAATDIEDRKSAEEALNKARSELAHVTRVTTLNALTASIAHEVNQPLSGIVSNASASLRFLAGDAPNLEEAREAIRDIVRDGKRAGEIITRIRALTKRAATLREKLDLNETISEVLALIGDEAKRHSVIVRTQFDDILSPVAGDRVQLQQVVLNLVMNAIEAMSSVSDRPRELVITTQNIDADCVQATVEDSGIGIASATVDKIFDSFYTTKPGGMGMGLSISRSILQSHGGRLWAVGKDAPGTMFHFTVPKYHEAGAHTSATGT